MLHALWTSVQLAMNYAMAGGRYVIDMHLALVGWPGAPTIEWTPTRIVLILATWMLVGRVLMLIVPRRQRA